MPRRVLAFVVAMLVLPAGMAQAQDRYPNRAVRLIVPFPPAGGADIAARTIPAKLTERFGQQVIVDNWPGAGGNVGTEAAGKSPPDGYTLLLVSSSAVIAWGYTCSSRFNSRVHVCGASINTTTSKRSAWRRM